jgi:hypothetical protein
MFSNLQILGTLKKGDNPYCPANGLLEAETAMFSPHMTVTNQK